jgi:hypothetical protein
LLTTDEAINIDF